MADKFAIEETSHLEQSEASHMSLRHWESYQGTNNLNSQNLG
jgi:hypothetical protein